MYRVEQQQLLGKLLGFKYVETYKFWAENKEVPVTVVVPEMSGWP